MARGLGRVVVWVESAACSQFVLETADVVCGVGGLPGDLTLHHLTAKLTLPSRASLCLTEHSPLLQVQSRRSSIPPQQPMMIGHATKRP